MAKKDSPQQRRAPSLSRESIIAAAIALLDSRGESGLTFRALAERLATGAGAIYWHVDNKDDLLAAACDAIVAGAISTPGPEAAPQEAIRALALTMFDAIDAHPWVGAALTRAPGQLALVRMLERLGQELCRLGVADKRRWATVSALLSYILGVAGQNAANTRLAGELDANRSDFLNAVAERWSALDPATYPFTRSVASQLRMHDDRDDFLAGIDLILAGIQAVHGV